MIEFLEKLRHLRGLEGRDQTFFAELTRVKAWQRDRLARTYPDLASDPRHAPATAFFLDELYGGKDSAIRDRDLIRMYPTIKRLLPEFAFETVSKAIELDVISEGLDQAVTSVLRGAPITESSYADAFRLAGGQVERLRQVGLMRDVGERLDVVVKKPLIYSTLKMLRGPAKIAGLGAMQQFLEAGFTAFRHMNGADHFLATIAERETQLIERIFAKHPQPFK
jgi:hypothetical protein